jgi:hypothetical protein
MGPLLDTDFVSNVLTPVLMVSDLPTNTTDSRNLCMNAPSFEDMMISPIRVYLPNVDHCSPKIKVKH